MHSMPPSESRLKLAQRIEQCTSFIGMLGVSCRCVLVLSRQTAPRFSRDGDGRGAVAKKSVNSPFEVEGITCRRQWCARCTRLGLVFGRWQSSPSGDVSSLFPSPPSLYTCGHSAEKRLLACRTQRRTRRAMRRKAQACGCFSGRKLSPILPLHPPLPLHTPLCSCGVLLVVSVVVWIFSILSLCSTATRGCTCLSVSLAAR